jgi:hypothetical protein
MMKFKKSPKSKFPFHMYKTHFLDLTMKFLVYGFSSLGTSFLEWGSVFDLQSDLCVQIKAFTCVKA